MPEPEVNETGFVPGDGQESEELSGATGENPVLQQGRDFMAAQFERIGISPRGETQIGSSDESEEASPVQEQDSSQSKATGQTSNQAVEDVTSQEKPETITLTQQELDRRIQQETDRRAALQAKKTEREQSKLRLQRLKESGDLEGFAAEYDAQEAKELSETSDVERRKQSLQEATLHFDGAVIDPIVGMLSESEQASLITALKPVGVAGRAAVLKGSVELLIQKAKAEGAAAAEKSLRNNQAFRKQILMEGREDEEEPELVIGSKNSNSGATDMNAWVDRALGRRR